VPPGFGIGTLHFPRWQVAILAVVIGGFRRPSEFLLEGAGPELAWLQQADGVGLDLQGGATDLRGRSAGYVQKRLKTLVSDVRKTLLQEPRIGYTGLTVQATCAAAHPRPRQARRCQEAPRAAAQLARQQSPRRRHYEFDPTVGDDGSPASPSSPGWWERLRGIVSQSIEVINSRINQLGTTEPSIQRQGDDRIRRGSGLGDPARLKALVGQTAQLTFHMVVKVDPKQPPQPKPGTVIFPSKESGAGVHGR
jgi:preprotein translocase subunit SecD